MNTRQAKAPNPIPFGREAFQDQPGTTVRWLGGAGALINSRGTTLMIDPVLEGFDMPLLADAACPPQPARPPSRQAAITKPRMPLVLFMVVSPFVNSDIVSVSILYHSSDIVSIS